MWKKTCQVLNNYRRSSFIRIFGGFASGQLLALLITKTWQLCFAVLSTQFGAFIFQPRSFWQGSFLWIMQEAIIIMSESLVSPSINPLQQSTFYSCKRIHHSSQLNWYTFPSGILYMVRNIHTTLRYHWKWASTVVSDCTTLRIAWHQTDSVSSLLYGVCLFSRYSDQRRFLRRFVGAKEWADWTITLMNVRYMWDEAKSNEGFVDWEAM